MADTPWRIVKAYTLTSGRCDEISARNDHVRHLPVATPPLAKAV
jgi:hypothetical protein